jgi:hypothetical protein
MKKKCASYVKFSKKLFLKNSAKLCILRKKRGKFRKTAQNAKFSQSAKTALNAQIFEFAAQKSAKSADFGRAKTMQKLF